MKQFLLAGLVAAVCVPIVPTASAGELPRYLTIPKAREDMAQALEHEFGYKAGTAVRSYLRTQECRLANSIGAHCTFAFYVKPKKIIRGRARSGWSPAPGASTQVNSVVGQVP